jgi:hypothetical protein
MAYFVTTHEDNMATRSKPKHPPRQPLAGAVLIDNLERSNALSNADVLAEESVYVPLRLRLVPHRDGFVIGIVDALGHTYAECEYYDDRATADAAWPEWVAALSYTPPT